MPVGFFWSHPHDRVAGSGVRRDGKSIARRRVANKRARRARKHSH